MSVSFNPYSLDHQADPYPVYRRLRDEAPVHRVEDSDVFVVSRYEDVQWVFRSADVFSSKLDRRRRAQFSSEIGPIKGMLLAFRFLRRMRVSPFAARDGRMLINSDGDVHAVMRRIVNRGFTPRQIAAWEPRIHEIARECMSGVRGRAEFDLVEQLAIPLPVTVISELLGVEPERRHDFKRWSDAIVAGGTGPLIGQPEESGLFEAMAELNEYLRPFVRARRREPRDDLISTLVDAQDGDAALTDWEIFLFVLLLLIAGNETTTNLLGNAVDALLDHPDQLALVASEPARIPDLIEETLRWDAPVQFLSRTVTRAVERHGVEIPAGAQVVILVGAANRDERQFPDADRFDIARESAGHIGFGFGAHFCLGASLARLEARSALEALVPELPGLARVRPEREFLDSYLLRGRARLELRAA